MKPVLDLLVVQRAYDLTLWCLPILNKRPRDQRFLLGDRIGTGL